jgi:hypothetical protein
LLFVAGCELLHLPAEPGYAGWDPECVSIAYRLKRLPENRLEITLTINDAGLNEFILPPVYADNPAIYPDEGFVSDISASDRLGDAVAIDIYEQQVGPRVSKIAALSFDSASLPVTLSYTINLSRIADSTARNTHPRQFAAPEQMTVLGSYAFAVALEDDLPSTWRTARRLSVHVPRGTIGTPDTLLIVRNAYELLFIQCVAGATRLATGAGGEQRFGVYSIDPLALENQPEWSIQMQAARALDSLIPRYGPLHPAEYPIFLTPSSGGLEGTYSFFIRPPTAENNHSTGMILVHEFLHHWIGVRCGEFDDPWWKEGAAQYLGWAYAARWGLASRPHTRWGLIGKWKEVDYPAFALSSAELRPILHRLGNNSLAYGRGGQLCMRLDLATRESSDNQATFGDVTRYLIDRFDGHAFARTDLLDAFDVFGVASADSLIAIYADRPVSIPDSILATTFDRLAALGAFGTDSLKRF